MDNSRSRAIQKKKVIPMSPIDITKGGSAVMKGIPSYLRRDKKK